MPYIETGSEERIDPATAADLERLFGSSRIFGVAVHQNKYHAVQATVTGGSTSPLHPVQKSDIGIGLAETQKVLLRYDEDSPRSI